MAWSKVPEETVERLQQCQRWDVCDAGTAVICNVELKTVYRFQRVAAHRAETLHRQVVRAVEVPGVQLDEAHSKLRRRQVVWIHTALAMGGWFLLWVDVGPRTQEMAAALIAQVVARTRAVPLLLTDGWKAYTAALLQVLGVVYQPRRRCQYTGGLRWSPALCRAAAAMAVGHHDSDGLDGTVVWDPAWPRGSVVALYSLPVLGAYPPPRSDLAAGQPLQFRDAPQKPVARSHATHAHKADGRTDYAPTAPSPADPA
jgi:hypothetical protein